MKKPTETSNSKKRLLRLNVFCIATVVAPCFTEQFAKRLICTARVTSPPNFTPGVTASMIEPWQFT
ncbi:MAG: hypothetical protein FWE25_02800 [Lachnospiraceae bacterium]|nr:hypothetical protein [Lachnospiraceae bacterium]